MKALILAGGLGTRLRPLTKSTPKPLVAIAGKPLLQYHLEQMQKYGVMDIMINTHHLADQIDHFVIDYMEKHPAIAIKTVFEKKLLGSAGTIKGSEQFFAGEKSFIVVNGDNLTNINYQKLIDFHDQKGGMATLACYYEHQPETKGIIIMDKQKKIQKFIEKPKSSDVVSHIANGGVYVYNRDVFSFLKSLTKPFLDISNDLFPELLAKGVDLYAYEMSEFLLDVGTVNDYRKAEEIIKKITF